MNFIEIFWIIFGVITLLSVVVPVIRMKYLQQARLAKFKQLEEKRKSRVISLIHRQESLAFLGIPILRYLTVDESEKILRAIRKTYQDVPIDMILHTPGGLLLAAEQIANSLKAHKAKVTVIVPHYAMSGGTLIALAANEVIIDKNGVLGPVDPQLNNMPAASILSVVSKKDINEIDDETLIMADVGEKAIQQVKDTIIRIVSDKMDQEKAKELAEKLAAGNWTHDFPIRVEEAKKLGLPVNTEVPEEVYDLMELYPQSTQRRPSVQYLPMPRRKEDESSSE
ncbi:MAG: ATP-dependent Clp protease proteolytic subunit [Alkalibacterium sp.]|uniref:SDH family Clp fold serine proteinase n=1 Tax=Alkalibacterium sp. TaxID=1872447 RepID=UPI003970F013